MENGNKMQCQKKRLRGNFGEPYENRMIEGEYKILKLPEIYLYICTYIYAHICRKKRKNGRERNNQTYSFYLECSYNIR